MLAALAFGWRYALLTATFGAVGFFAFHLWPTNGWANLVNVVIFTSWFVWHGHCAERRAVKASFWNNLYGAQLLYSIFFNVLLFSTFPWIFRLNPPFWYPAAATSMPMPVIESIAIKETVLLFLQIFLCDLLLKLPPVRRVFLLPISKASRFNLVIIGGAILIGIAVQTSFFVVHSIMRGDDMGAVLTHVRFNEYMDLIVLIMILSLVAGLQLSKYVEKRLIAEDELKTSEERFRAIYNSVNDAIFIHDRETGAILDVNTKMCEMFGYTHAEALAISIGDISSGDPSFTQQDAVEKVQKAAAGVPQLFEWHCKAKSGRLFWGEVNMMSAVVGGVDRVIVTVRDITERKRVEERLDIATHAAHIGIWDWDIVKNVLVWDDSMYALYGIRKEDFGGAYDAWSRTIHPEDKARIEGEIQAALRGEREYAPEFRILWPDGSIRHIKADSRTFRSDDGHPLRMVGTNIDITELKRSEEEKARLEVQLAQAQKMEAIGTLAGGIAHDFNNILSPIVGYTELARMRSKNDPKLTEYLNQVREAASRATDLVRQILTFSRKDEQQKVPLQVSSVVKEALKLLRSSIPTSIEIRQEVATQALVLADPTRVHQIVMNLCTNAYQAMEKTGGVLNVSLKETEILHGKVLGGEIRPGRYVVLEVSDTGCGMDKETQANIFEPYFTTKETGKGTGLGLAVVHGIVKDHQGMINVYSEPGKGSTFRVSLPMTENQTHAAHAKQDEATPTERHEHILFVDDEERICNMAKAYMAEYGYEVDVCNNGRDALFVIEQDLKAYDLLITDMTMPGMNGKELAKKVLALRPDLPVILCTGYSSLIDREEAARIGIRAYVEKPVLINDLIGRIKDVLKERNTT